MTKLPTGWARATLGDLVLLSQAKADPRTTSADKYIGLEHINKDSGTINGVGEPSQVRSTKAVFRKGDLLYGKLRPYLNKVWLAEFDGVCSTDILVFSHLENVNHAFLKYRLLSQDFVKFAQSRVRGMQHPRVSFKSISDFPIDLPPLNEQKRIVARIEELLSELDVGVREARATLDKLPQRKEAVLRDAFTGELTRTWREQHGRSGETARQLLNRILQERRICYIRDQLARLKRRKKAEGCTPSEIRSVLAKERCRVEARYKEPDEPDANDLPTIPDGWLWTTLETFADVAGGITVNKRRRVLKPRRVPYLRVANVQRGHIDLSEVKTIEVEADELPFLLLKKGDILLNEGGDRDKLGRGWVWNGELPKCTHQNHVFRARPFISDLDPRFVSRYINECGQVYFFERATQTTNLASISKSKVNKLPIPLPHFEEHKVILAEIDRQMKAADLTEAKAVSGIANVKKTREAILRDAFCGKLTRQDAYDESASILLERVRIEKAQVEADRRHARRIGRARKSSEESQGVAMKTDSTKPHDLQDAFKRIKEEPDAERLFDVAGYDDDQVFEFYDLLSRTPSTLREFEKAADINRRRKILTASAKQASRKTPPGRFRLDDLWLEQFRNLENYTVRFDRQHALDILLGWNGTGKSNLFEALVIIFRDLYKWKEKNRWEPDEMMRGYRIRYEIEDRLVEVNWDSNLRRPQVRISGEGATSAAKPKVRPCSREGLLLPHFVFGYYSGPSSRFLELFSDLKQEHYGRLLNADLDDAETLTRLLEERRFFCAETLHAKYALLAFFYREDPKIRHFLRRHLRIEDFESVLFVLKRPRWFHNNDPRDFWGAFGVLRPFLERLRCLAVAPMVRRQKVDDGYQESMRDLYFLFLPGKERLQALAAQYPDASSFFVALESTDFSSIIQEVRIRIRINATASKQISITFKDMSEGEQQLLMVLGLLRFTKTNQSLILLDEPDTHLNPHWQLDYLRLLFEALVGDTECGDSEAPCAPIEVLERRLTSQVLLATHDPIAIAGLLKENIHLLKRDPKTEACICLPATENPRGMGFTGILTSEMFGLRSDLDPETLDLLDRHVDLAGKRALDSREKKELRKLTAEIEALGFKSASSDPYYRAFIQALARKHEVRGILRKPIMEEADWEELAHETDQILAQIEKEEAAKRK